jgi:hypothetical protein
MITDAAVENENLSSMWCWEMWTGICDRVHEKDNDVTQALVGRKCTRSFRTPATGAESAQEEQ